MNTTSTQGLAVTLPELLNSLATKFPDNLALAAPGRTELSYRALAAHIDCAQAAMRECGLGHGDRIALVLPNGPEMAAAFLAVAGGAVCAPLNPRYRAEEFDFYLSDLGVKALIVEAGSDSAACAVARSRGIDVIELAPAGEARAGVFSLHGSAGRVVDSRPAQGEDVALLLHTSGTTSRPKLVPLLHKNLCASAFNIGRTLRLSPDDCCLNVMPLFHIHGLVAALLSSLAAGGKVVCAPDFSASGFFEWISEFRPSWYTAVPTMHQAVLAHANEHAAVIANHRLRFIRSSSAALPAPVMAELEGLFGVPVIESYGMTEAAHQMASNPLPPAERKPRSVGIEAGPEVAIMDAAGAQLPQGQSGEVVIRGANVTPGYENNVPANQASFSNGWFRTGDQGYLDADGTSDDLSSMNLSGAAAKPLAGENDPAQNPFDLARRYGPSLFDARHRFVASASWMPTVSAGAPAAVRAIIGGWQLNAIVTHNSGTPFTVSDSANVALQANSPPISGFPASRPNLVGDPNAGPHTVNEWPEPVRVPASERADAGGPVRERGLEHRTGTGVHQRRRVAGA